MTSWYRIRVEVAMIGVTQGCISEVHRRNWWKSLSSIMVLGAIHPGRSSVLWWCWMAPWTAAATLRFCGISGDPGQLHSLATTLYSPKSMRHRKLQEKLLPLLYGRVSRCWTGLLEVHTRIPLSMCGIECLSGLETWTTHLPMLLNHNRLPGKYGAQ